MNAPRLEIKKSKILWLFVLSLSFVFSCGKKEKWIDREDPELIPDANLFDNYKNAEEYFQHTYWFLREGGSVSGHRWNGLGINMGLYADELTHRPSPAGRDDQLLWSSQLESGQQFLEEHLGKSLGVIQLFIGASGRPTDLSELSQSEQDRILGEGYFIRAFSQFNLSNTYGSFPYYVTLNTSPVRPETKQPVSEIYERALDELKKSLNLLGNDYSGSERTRINTWAVRAVMARLYLYQEDWGNAAILSSEIIDNTGLFALESDLDRVFLTDSKEAIWQLPPEEEGDNTLEGEAVDNLIQEPYSRVTISDDLLASFEPGDRRKQKWLKQDIAGNPEYWYPYKYKEAAKTGSVSKEYSVVLRLAEQILIRAEAYAQQGKIQEALQDLNKIRNRANLPSVSLTGKDAVLDAILQERRVELFLEHGHRFYDLKRVGRAEEFLKPIKPRWNDNHLVWPISDTFLNLFAELAPQNPGY